MNRRLLFSVVFVLLALVIGVNPQAAQACESCSGGGGPSEDECILTWTGASTCSIRTRCILLYCFTICQQSDYMCSVNDGGGGPPRV
jgi:hypothetical protein